MAPKNPRETLPWRKPPLAPREVAEVVREALGPEGSILPSRHFRERGQEKNFAIRDALAVLEGGTVAPTPRWNERTGTWNYDVRGADVEGDSLTVRIAIEGPCSIVLVTAF